MSSSSISEDGRREFWSLLDRSFTSLHSPIDFGQKEKIVISIESIFVNLKDWKFLTHTNCTSLYKWLVQHFSEILINNDLGQFHEKIISCSIKLLQALAAANPVLFNGVIKSFLFIINRILNEIDEFGTNISLYITLSQDVVVPFAVKNKFPALCITKHSSFVSIFKCFYEVCSQNVSALLIYAKCQMVQIITVFCKIVHILKEPKGRRIVLLLASKALPLLTLKEWNTICSCLELMEVDSEILSAFAELLDIFSTMPCHPDINFLLLTKAIEIISLLFDSPMIDINKWIQLAIVFIDMISIHYIKQLNISSLLIHTSSNKVLHQLFISYFKKSLMFFFSTKEHRSDYTKMSEIDHVWKILMENLNKLVENALSDSENRLDYLENIICILSIAMKMIPLSTNYCEKVIWFDMVTDRIFNLFLLADSEIINSQRNVITNLVKLSKMCIFILKEKNSLDPGCTQSLFSFLIIPWKGDSRTSSLGDLKSVCYDSLLSLYTSSLDTKDSKFSLKIVDILFTIASNEKDYFVPFVHSLLISITYLSNDVDQDIYSDFLKKCVNPATVESLFRSSLTRDILPCFYAGCCIVISDEMGMTLKCNYCDLQKQIISHLDLGNSSHLNFVGFSYIKLLLKDVVSNDLRSKLLKSLGRYVFHIVELKSDMMLKVLSEFMAHHLLNTDFDLESVINCLLFDSQNNSSLDQINSVLNTLLNVFENNKKYTNSNWKTRLFDFLIAISRLSREFLFISTKFLVTLTFNDNFSNIEINRLKQKLIGTVSFHHMKMKELLIKYEKELCKIWVDTIIYNIKNNKCDIESTIANIARIFEMSPRVFLEFHCTGFMVAYTLINCDLQQARFLLGKLSKMRQIRMKDIIMKDFPIIFSTVYFLDDEECSSKALASLEKLCESSIDTLIYYAYKDLICYIMINTHKPLKVIRFFELYALDEEATVANSGDILLKYAMGFLTFIDAKLSSKSSSSYMIQASLRSIPNLINLLGNENLAPIRIKLLATLRTGLPLHYESYPKQCLEVWMYFVYCIELSFLGPYLTTIFTLLKPLFNIYPYDISKIFHYLVVQNGHLYSDYIPELIFVEDSSISEMHAVWEKIQEANKRLEVGSIMQRTLEHIRNGAVESRIHSLEYLYNLLKIKQGEILKMIHQNDQLPSIFKEIVDCLMLNIHNGNLEVKRMCAYCLGEIGAINPAKFGYRHKELCNPHDEIKKCFDVKDTEFAYLIILELTKALQKSEDSHSYNIIASSIQELLKLYYPVVEGEVNTDKIHEFFDTFPRNECNILKSMVGSRYIFSEPVLVKRRREKVGFNVGKNTFEWVSSWASGLIALMPSDSMESKVFKTSLPAIQLDSEALEAIIPYILLQTILSCSEEEKQFVEMEMKFILKFQEQTSFIILPQNLKLFKSSFKKTDKFFSSEIKEEKCVAIILDLIDFLYKYCSYLKVLKKNPSHLKNVSEFLRKFPRNFLSLKSYMLKDYCRSLYYMERRLASSHPEPDITPLRNIYAKLNDADGLLGVVRTSNNIPTNEENMLNHIVCGHIQDALPAYELFASKNENNAECYRALVQCYLNINSPCVAMKLANSFFNQRNCFAPTFCSELVEVAWKNLMFYDLNDQVQRFDGKLKSNWSWSIDVGLTYIDFFNLEFSDMKKKIDSIRGHIAERLAAISNTTIGTYRQGYSHIVILQTLNELEKYADLLSFVGKFESSSRLKAFFDNLNMDSRLQLLPANGYFISNVVSSRIQALSMINKMEGNIPLFVQEFISNELGNSYLIAARIARKNSNFQLAYSYLALAENYQPHGLFIEKAKLHKYKFETEVAISILKQGVQDYSEATNTCVDATLHKLSAQAKLLIARYNVENMNVDYNEGTRSYFDAVNTFPNEKSHRYLAQYLYQIYRSDSLADNSQKKCDIQIEAMKNFGNSLRYGCKYIYQSMFCMTSLWLDFGMRFKEILDAAKTCPRVITKSHDDAMSKLNTIMLETFHHLPSFMFMAVFSQLLSRINHPLAGCQQLLIQIISQVAIDFPQQAFWMMAPIWKTDDSIQNKLFKEILTQMKNLETTLNRKCTPRYSVTQFYSVFNELVDVLINICNKQVPPDATLMPLKSISMKLKLLLNKNDINVMIPAQKFRTISLPNVKHFDLETSSSSSCFASHNPFPLNLAYFFDVEEEVQILTSLQRPKKLVFRGSDGLSYPFMCKPMDDLRLDSRIMEFCAVVNMYLQRDPSSCDRHLHIKTYSVVPINPQNGLIEWVPNMLGVRTLLIKMYKMKNCLLPTMQQVKMKIEASKTAEEKLKLFENVLLPQHPPMLHKWFFHQFQSPDSWYLARKSYVRTTAVMSIVGYIVGLGDRHTENILIDTTTGELMHVDYNCLFGRGELLQVPEVVPFRLTQNMIKAMGSTGIEGHFMNACQITTRVIRNHSDQLLYVVKPFLYDPKLQKNARYHEKTKADINTIEKKMSGFVITPKKKTQALSVEGQVRCLIAEATNHQNLSLMFHGWLPFM